MGLSIDDVRAAASRIEGRIRRTPTLRCPALDEVAGTTLWLKAENLQRIGAFKARGAMHAVGQLSPQERERGVITFSSGNHAQAVALAAKEYGVPATIAMPTDAPEIKVNAVRGLGAEIIFAGTTSDDRKAVALEVAERTGGAVIQPFDHAHIIAGAGTAALELFEDAPSLDALVVPVGGGGMIAGASLVCEAHGVPVYAVEPVGCDSLGRSLAADEVVAVQPGPTIADGLKPVSVGKLNFEVAKRAVRGAFTVDDEALGVALVRLLVRAKVLVEPSGAAALAVALGRKLPGEPKNVGVLLSGGNVDPKLVASLLDRHGATA